MIKIIVLKQLEFLYTYIYKYLSPYIYILIRVLSVLRVPCVDMMEIILSKALYTYLSPLGRPFLSFVLKVAALN